MPTSDKTIARLSLYRRLLGELKLGGTQNTFSHQLAKLAGVSAAQVRRDLMTVGYHGSPTRGYDVDGLGEAIGASLDAEQGQSAALIGVGNLGRAILAYFAGRRPRLSIAAGFDTDPEKVNRVVLGTRCYPMSELNEQIAREKITVAILTVPASEAQTAAEAVVRAGVKGILNFAPTPLHLPPGVYVEQVDITTSLEKVAYFARQR